MLAAASAEPPPEPPDEYVEASYYQWVSGELQEIGDSLRAIADRLDELHYTELTTTVRNTRDAVLTAAEENKEDAERLFKTLGITPSQTET